MKKFVSIMLALAMSMSLAALTAACYLVQDGQMEGSRVHIL